MRIFKRNNQSVGVGVILAFLMGFAPLWVSASENSIFTTHDLSKMEMKMVDSEFVRERLIQIANEVDYFDLNACVWRISEKLEFGGEEYYILYRDCYGDRYYYLCRQPVEGSYPQTILLCIESMGGDTMQSFVIDGENDTLTITDHELISRVNDGSHEYLGKYYVTTSIYQLSDDFKLISSDSSYKILPEAEAIIQTL